MSTGTGLRRHEDPDRTTPTGMARYGFEFLESAFMVDEQITRAHPDRAMWVPAYYLLGHGLEVTLKAYLLHKQRPLQFIRSLNHDLVKALDACLAEGLGVLVSLDPKEVSDIALLNALYSVKELEYIVTGSKQIPDFSALQSISIKIYKGIAAQTLWRGSLDRWVS